MRCFRAGAGFNSGQLIPGRCQATATIGGAFSTQARNDEQQGTLLPGRPALSNPVRPPVDFKYSSAHGPALSNLGNEPFERPGECGMSRCGSLDPVQTLAAISPLCWCDVACVRRGDCCKDHTRSCALGMLSLFPFLSIVVTRVVPRYFGVILSRSGDSRDKRGKYRT